MNQYILVSVNEESVSSVDGEYGVSVFERRCTHVSCGTS